ncbi:MULTISPECIES: endonuclease [unclassified Lysobacter]|uniref:endonuclease n=1 Tax=unclassified Lysobacter TaxID=2635362 RepID=UPI0006F2AC00|nr:MULTISPECIES: endonuclease [unclassified Lysobacter]KRA16159.1 ribonuclease [Lysobacter sp. Root604]KRD31861.1 ribonuclease [Lysobacter sp. Root916]KRD75730.1 ribonuclease [Lysobacter sp. Root983]
MSLSLRRSCLSLSCLSLLMAAALPTAAPAAVFINEFHYDDATSAGDVGEKIEVVATAGETLSNYRIYLYNGSTPSAATSYDNDLLPAGSLVSCGGSVRIGVLSYPTNGIQNGSNDGFALVDGSGNVVQFLSYEGAITASSGPAAGMTSTNLPVSESGSTAAGTSLRLSGSGSTYANFTWQASAAQSFGACNAGQTFSTPNPAPTVTSTTPANGSNSFPAAGDLAVSFSEAVTLGSGALTLQCASSGTIALTYPSSGTSFTASTGTALVAGESCTYTVVAAQVTDSGGAHPSANTVVNFSVASGGGGGGYYAHVNTSSASQLRCSLHETIKGHTVYPYSGGTTNTWTILEIADEDPNNSGRILDAYRNRSYLKVTDRAGSGSGLKYNREHTWPNSLGFGSTTGNLGLPYAPYTDTHMLYLTDATWNADRGNKPYADCTLASGCGERITEANAGYGGGSGVYPGNSNWVKTPDGNAGSFQVWNHMKGNMARAVLYMAIRYEGDSHPVTGQGEPDLELTDDRSKIVITSSSPAYMGLLSTLLAWHTQDPPDAAELERNEVIFSFQGNRNPFIDHPEWASNALFTSSKPASCVLIP